MHTAAKRPAPDVQEFLRAVGAAYAAGADRWIDGGIKLSRILGGGNNALYQIEANGQHYACKLCVNDGRSRARREYDALHVLHSAGLDVAPEPVGLDESCTAVPYPAVIYRWVYGRALRPPLSADRLIDLLDSVQVIHSLRPSDCPDEIKDAWFHWFDVAQYLSELESFLEQYGVWLADTDPGLKIMRVYNRIFFAILWAAFFSVFEIFLARTPAFVWVYSWWGALPVFVTVYIPFFLVALLCYDWPQRTQWTVIGTLFTINVLALILFAGLLQWI